MIGYLLGFSFLHMIVTGELGILITFIGLRYGDYNWQWRSFWAGAASTLYVATYTIWQMVTHLDMALLSDDLIYLLWSFLFLLGYALLTGASSALASTLFINLMYQK